MSKARELASLGTAYSDGSLSNRNLIINGAMQVAQRGTSFTNATTSWAYSLDRWRSYSEAGVSATVDKVSITKDGVSVDALHWQQPSTTGSTYLGQVIEGTYLRGKTVTVSFWVDTVSNVNVVLYDNVTTLTTPQAVTTGRNTYTATFASNFSADTASLYFHSPAGASELKVTDVQLEVGDTATPFEHRSYGQELALCQRYYYTINAAGHPSPNSSAYHRFMTFGQGTDSLIWYPQYPVEMRVVPTLIKTNFTSSTVNIFNYTRQSEIQISSVINAEGGKQAGQIAIYTAGGVFAGDLASWRWIASPNAAISFDAEL